MQGVIAMLRSTHVIATLCCILLLSAAPARAGEWDLQVSRLCQLETSSGQIYDCGGGYTRAIAATDPVKLVLPDNAAFRALMSELGAIFTPNILAASDTEGYGGFSFSFQFGLTTINPKNYSQDPILDRRDDKTMGRGLPYWRAAKSVNNAAFPGRLREYPDGRPLPQESIDALARMDQELPGTIAPTIAVMIRKGIWMPLPSFELGVGVKHLLGSNMWGPTATAKLSLHEGFQGWPVPAIAVRGSGTRVMGSPDFNLTVIGIDASVSKHFGIADSFNVTPYAGYQFLIMVTDSEQVDATPAINPYEETYPGDPTKWNTCDMNASKGDCSGNFAFADLSNIMRHRAFFGLRANIAFATVSLEYTYFTAGGTDDKIDATTPTAWGGKGEEEVIIPDSAGAQHSWSIAVGLDF